MKIEKSRKKFDTVYWLLCTRSQLRLSQRGNETRESAIFHITSWFVLFSCRRCFCLEDFPIRKFYDFDIANFIYPCRRLTQASYEYSEYVSRYYKNLIRADSLENSRHEPGSLVKNVSFDSFSVSLQFSSDRYKEIVLSRQFDLQNLIGNAGGYVGICVGYSFLQLPKSITIIVLRIKSYIRYNKL